ncbi:MAG: hypothetical protein PHH11_18095 [Methylomonas sp.]|nr:hypothetical protein [Methylomonas sp.]
MSKFNKSPLRLSMARWLPALLISAGALADSAKDSAIQPATAIAEEGRRAVEFYRDPLPSYAVADASRLSAKTPAYPAVQVERLPPLFELGDPFLGNGPIRPGIETPTGQMLQPWFLLYGSLRSALQSFEDGRDHNIEWANRLDLNGNLNLSGTERVLFSLRPIDGQSGKYSGYNFQPGDDEGWREDFNTRLTKLYFEGELGEIFPGLDPGDSSSYDVGFSVGRQQLTAQDGILLNDNIDAVGLTRNSLMLPGISNLRLTGYYGWNHVNRGNNDNRYRVDNHSARLFGLQAEADTALENTVALDLLHVGGEGRDGAWYFGAASTQRFGELNSTFRANASIPERGQSENAGRGVLLLSQLSTALGGGDNNLYCNTFVNIGRFTSAARGPDMGSPLASLGILHGPVGMGRYGVPLDGRIEDTVGASVGYQLFMDGIASQLIFEAGARTSTRGERDEGMLGFGARYQHAFGKRYLLRLDTFVAGKEASDVNYGFRTEWSVKF